LAIDEDIFDALEGSSGEDEEADTGEEDSPEIIENPDEEPGEDIEIPVDDESEPGKPDADDEEPEGLATDEESNEEPIPFSPPKKPASSVIGRGPRKLNKQLILSAVLGVMVIFVIITLFVLPMAGKKKKADSRLPGKTPVTAVDYSSLVPKKKGEPEDIKTIEENFMDDDEIMQSLPPVNPDYQYRAPEPEKPAPPNTSGSATAPERPNTRNDRLQAKSISGIKGITPTQKQYVSGSGYQPPEAMAAAPSNPYAQFGMPPKDEYMAQMLSQYSQGTSASYQAGNNYANQNDQSGKMNFYNSGRENAGNGTWLGPYTIWQGTIFEATLTSAINTDLPGEITAVISKNVYSSLDGRYMLIPQNSKLYGSYNSSISYSQSRIQVGWHTLIRPDGYFINLGNMAATDAQGAAGLKGFINDHPFQYLKALALMSVFNIVSGEFENTASGSNNQYVQNLMADTQNVVATLGSKLIDRAMDVQPTITIKAGLKINIVANTNLALPPIEPYEVSMPYHR
jgi:type IV secretion system protein VirB10